MHTVTQFKVMQSAAETNGPVTGVIDCIRNVLNLDEVIK